MGSADSFAAEAFTLLSIGISVIGLRTFARIRQVGVRNFEADDYLMLLVIIPYTIETALAYTVGAKFHGLTNSGMTDEERKALSPNSDEFGDRVGGSKIQIAGWLTYATCLWVIKSALCAFYFRLTVSLTRHENGVTGLRTSGWTYRVQNSNLHRLRLHRLDIHRHYMLYSL